MTDAPRDWRDAKIPQWVKDAVADEMKAVEMRAALSWPTEGKPQPAPFRWLGYDRETGEPVEGTQARCSVGRALGSLRRSRRQVDVDQTEDGRMSTAPERIWAEPGTDSYPSCKDWDQGGICATTHWDGAVEYIRADIAALVDRIAPVLQAPVRVKPLVWLPNTDYRTDGVIAGGFDGWWTCHGSDDFATFEYSNPWGKTKYGFPSIEAAQAAAQADYTARILAALDGGE
jgi:hypothetical protein